MKQSEMSREWMAQSLLRLMHQKHFSKITIKDITDNAGVSRLTFYRNFDSKEQILEFYIEKRFDAFMDVLNQQKNLDLRSAAICCFRFWENNSEHIQLFIQQGLTAFLLSPFERHFYTILEQFGINKEFTYFQCQFLIGGMFANMIAWLKNPQSCSAENVTDEIMGIISQN